MGIVYEVRGSDSPYVETITQGWTPDAGSTIRPAECHWHMVLARPRGRMQAFVVGPLAKSGIVSWGEGAEILWIKFKLGTFIPHLPTRDLLDLETLLPEAASNSFWLKGSAWQFPDFENADTFVNRLMREDILAHDPLVKAALDDQPAEVAPRTLRHRFLHSTGLTQTYIRQMQRAQQAAALLERGMAILDVVDAAGYFDQPHLTRALRQFIGHTPAEIVWMRKACHSIQDSDLRVDYPTNVLETQALEAG